MLLFWTPVRGATPRPTYKRKILYGTPNMQRLKSNTMRKSMTTQSWALIAPMQPKLPDYHQLLCILGDV